MIHGVGSGLTISAGVGTLSRSSVTHFSHQRPDIGDPPGSRRLQSASAMRVLESSSRSGATARWGRALLGVRASELCVVLEGAAELAVDGHVPITLEAAISCSCRRRLDSSLSGFEPVTPDRIDARRDASAPTGEVRHGKRGGKPDVRLLGGYFVFDSPDAALLMSLLPTLDTRSRMPSACRRSCSS